MKRIIAGIGVIALSLIGSAFAASGTAAPQAVISFSGEAISIKTALKKKFVAKPRPVSLGKFFVDVCSRLGQGMPEVYKDVNISWPNLTKTSHIYAALQKCAYLGIIERKGKINDFSVPVKGNFVYDFFGEKLNMDVEVELEPDEPVTTDIREEELRYRVPTYYAIERLLKISGWGSNGAYESSIINSTYFTTFAQIYNQLKENYHNLSGNLNDDNLIYGAIKGMVDSLGDPYSVYFAPEQAADFVNSIQGTFYGVGMYLDARDGKPVISSTIPGEPASLAGLQAQDIIIKVDDWEVPAIFAINDVINRIKGKVDTTVNITVQRGTSTLTIPVKRKKISIPLMKTEKKGKSMLFTITSFGQGTTYQFLSGVDTFKDDIAAADKIIIDVRNNPGGYLEEAAGILGFFVPKGEPVVQMEEATRREILLSQGYSDIFSGKQLYLLINGGSASASEILVGTLKDYFPAAKIIGEKSYGKGSAQAVSYLPNGGSVKYTIALWYTGKLSKSIEKVGITPDIELKDDPKTTNDELLDKILSW